MVLAREEPDLLPTERSRPEGIWASNQKRGLKLSLVQWNKDFYSFSPFYFIISFSLFSFIIFPCLFFCWESGRDKTLMVIPPPPSPLKTSKVTPKFHLSGWVWILVAKGEVGRVDAGRWKDDGTEKSVSTLLSSLHTPVDAPGPRGDPCTKRGTRRRHKEDSFGTVLIRSWFKLLRNRRGFNFSLSERSKPERGIRPRSCRLREFSS